MERNSSPKRKSVIIHTHILNHYDYIQQCNLLKGFPFTKAYKYVEVELSHAKFEDNTETQESMLNVTNIKLGPAR